jgi:hypothetical protein
MTNSFVQKWLTDAGNIAKNWIEHNHKHAKSPSMTKQMSGHEMKEAVVDDMVNIMHKARVSHVKVMHVLHESVGGP